VRDYRYLQHDIMFGKAQTRRTLLPAARVATQFEFLTRVSGLRVALQFHCITEYSPPT
jgi:hypothetical protein